MKTVEIIELNENNCKEYTIEELCAIAGIDPSEFNDEKEEVSEEEELKNDVVEFYNIVEESANIERKDKEGNFTEEYKAWSKIWYDFAVYFKEKYGEEKLVIFNQYKTLKSKIDYVVYNKGVLKRHKNNKRNSQTKEY